jgi:myo-inositol-1(or 4)-monophosphatase
VPEKTSIEFDPAEFAGLLTCAHDLADLAAPLTLKHFRSAMLVDNKSSAGDFDPVTVADRAAEQAMRQEIAVRFPDHGIAGEEFAETAGRSQYRWILDPIDGTRSFIMGWPMWGMLIGLVRDGLPYLGLMDQPFTKERFWCSARAAHYRYGDGTSGLLKTRTCDGLSAAVLSTTHPDLFEPGEQADGFGRIKRAVRMTRYGGDCYAYAMLAAGHCDLVVEAGLKPHDIAALVPIIERAGGVVTTWKGEAAINGGNIVAAGDAKVHEQAVALLSG